MTADEFTSTVREVLDVPSVSVKSDDYAHTAKSGGVVVQLHSSGFWSYHAAGISAVGSTLAHAIERFIHRATGEAGRLWGLANVTATAAAHASASCVRAKKIQEGVD